MGEYFRAVGVVADASPGLPSGVSQSYESIFVGALFLLPRQHRVVTLWVGHSQKAVQVVGLILLSIAIQPYGENRTHLPG